jgi:acyl carrier protein
MSRAAAIIAAVGARRRPGFLSKAAQAHAAPLPTQDGKDSYMADSIEAKVKELICQQLEVSEDQLAPHASFTDDLKADSLAVVELVLALEQEFDMEIPDEETEKIKTVQDAISYIKAHAAS